MFINYAHRGASTYFPENTMSSFYAGLSMGANGIETDIQKTKDDVLVLFHDSTLLRVTGQSGSIQDYTYEQLQLFNVVNKDYNRYDRILRLEDFLRFFSFRDLSFAIELKQDHVEKETIDMLESFGIRDKVILTSFNFDSLINAKAYNPSYKVGYLYDQKESDALGKLKSIGGEQLCPRATMIIKQDVEYYHEQGMSVRAWGISTPEIMRKVYEAGVDGMTVNFPDLLTELMNS